ncbi:MAG TPA: sigma-54 dependent transcriptional regulator [Ignavibacteriaceae bacterium]|nr:sigma-54 dependent transcriptional regulator [Ignavibacteriaceae bacterium]
MKDSLLIIDDEADIRNLLLKLLNLEGYKVLCAENGKNGLALVQKEDFGVVLADVRLPDINGLELIQKIKKINPLTEVIIITAYGKIEDGVRAIKEGAFDYITKGDEDNKIIPVIERAMEKVKMGHRIEQLEKQVAEKYNFGSIYGKSKLLNSAVEVARKVSETDVPVLLTGETGTGKELFAQAIHYTGKRSRNNFVAINCSAFAKELLESEMFGYMAGAFTGANKNKKGLFEEANKGTLFLDEIGELDLALQAKFLRVLETNNFIKAGDTKPTQVDVRIIAASNRNLEEEIEKGNFRSDLYYRISVMKIEIPPLRKRKEDIQALAEYFIKFYAKKIGRNITGASPSFYEKLINYDFPGNIRELRNIIERAVILSEGGILNESVLPKEIEFKSSEPLSSSDLESVEKNHILSILEQTNGNKTKTAEILGIGLTTLYRKLQSYGIE